MPTSTKKISKKKKPAGSKKLSKKQLLEAHSGDLEFLANCDHTQRKNFLKSKTKRELVRLVSVLQDLADRLLHNAQFVKQISDQHRRVLREQHKENLQFLAKKSNHSKKLKFITSQRGGGILSAIWSGIKEFFQNI